jgi:hypothetical protein
MSSERFNQTAFRPTAFYHPHLRGEFVVREHNQMYHEFPEATPAIAIPADKDGVVP